MLLAGKTSLHIHNAIGSPLVLMQAPTEVHAAAMHRKLSALNMGALFAGADT
jgi:hypothetical protein